MSRNVVAVAELAHFFDAPEVTKHCDELIINQNINPWYCPGPFPSEKTAVMEEDRLGLVRAMARDAKNLSKNIPYQPNLLADLPARPLRVCAEELVNAYNQEKKKTEVTCFIDS